MSDWTRVDKYLRRIAETDGITEEHLWNMGHRQGLEEAGTQPLTEDSVESWRRFRNGEALSTKDRGQLEAIVLPNGLRPTFDIQNDSFADLPEPWNRLNSHRQFLESCIRGIGRLNVPGHALLQYAGTAFVVGRELLLTNRHVAEVFCQTGGDTLTFTPGILPNLDFKQEVGNNANIIINIIKPLVVLTDWDAALLRCDALPTNVQPLRLAQNSPADITNRLATIIGYPALDTRGSTEEILQQIQIFRAIFDKKRLQPGRLMGEKATKSFGSTVAALAHDCSTLGGNSGSAVIDVESDSILGLHFGGDYLVANYSVPSWELARHQRLHEEGMIFV